MDQTANKALVRQYIELWNTGNLTLADEVLAADFVDYAHPELTPGPESVKRAIMEFRTGFPDAQATIEHTCTTAWCETCAPWMMTLSPSAAS